MMGINGEYRVGDNKFYSAEGFDSKDQGKSLESLKESLKERKSSLTYYKKREAAETDTEIKMDWLESVFSTKKEIRTIKAEIAKLENVIPEDKIKEMLSRYKKELKKVEREFHLASAGIIAAELNTKTKILGAVIWDLETLLK